jgi:hypothetical protein
MKLAVIVTAMCVSSTAAWAQEAAPETQPAEQRQPATITEQARQDDQSNQQTHQSHAARANDPNYRYYNGRWWYWQNGGYLMWNGTRWVPASERRTYSYAPSYAPSYSYMPRRSFSYIQEPNVMVNDGGDMYIPTSQGMPMGGSGMRFGGVTPYSVEYQKVLPSFGVRSAGAKVLGDY